MAKDEKRIGEKMANEAPSAIPTACVAIAGLASARQAIGSLFSSLPLDTGAAFLVALRRDGDLPLSSILELIGGATSLPVTAAIDAAALEPNNIYVADHADLLTVQGGRIVRQSGSPRGRIDSLLVSVAEAYQEAAIIVVLAGLADEGAAGVAATKQCGGFAVAEGSDETLEPADRAISAAGIADMRVPAERIGQQIASYIDNLVRTEDGDAVAENLQDDVGEQIARIATVLRNATGNDFHGYKHATFQRRVQRRMQVVQIDEIDRYIERLRGDAVEVQHLFQDLLIGVTQFFRDPTEFDVLANLIHRDLRLDLRAALHKAGAQNTRIEARNVVMTADGVETAVNIVVEPIAGGDEPGALVVLFQDGGPPVDGAAGRSSGLDDEHVQRLEADLRIAKERLQTTIEELESTTEELKSSNEEYQSINEELQSANEELETSKEELQAVNEELQTVNGELAHRVAELGRANSDLKNLLESTQIATMFLDNDLRLRSFTPATTEVFHLIETDAGRPIAHIASRVSYAELLDDARRVMRSLGQVEREVVSLEGNCQFLVRVLPYRSVDNFIAGVVVTFLEITGTARAEAALRKTERRFIDAQQRAGIGVWEWRPDNDETWWSPIVYQLWGLPAAETPPPLSERRFLGGDGEIYGAAVEHARRTGELNVEWRIVMPDGSVRWLAESGRLETSDGATRMLGVTQDITERKHTENRLTLLLGELQHRVRNILGVVRSVVSRTVRSATDIDDLAASLDGRLDTLARTQSVFTRNAAALDLEEMIRDELMSVAAREEQLTIGGPALRLRREAAETMALALHELTTNAIKYGALSEPAGKLSVLWRLMNTSRGKRLSLDWHESGVRTMNLSPSRSGFGRDLIERGLPFELGANTALEFGRGGLRATIELPLSDTVAEFDEPLETEA